MQTKIILYLLIISGLISCSNQATDSSEGSKNAPSDPNSTTFTIISEQDTITKNGESVLKYKNGVIRIQGMMKDGKRDGLWKSFYENGLPWSETTFLDGFKNGKTTTWYENGNKRYEGFYTNDLESGKWTYWNEEGKLVTTKDYGIK